MFQANLVVRAPDKNTLLKGLSLSIVASITEIKQANGEKDFPLTHETPHIGAGKPPQQFWAKIEIAEE